MKTPFDFVSHIDGVYSDVPPILVPETAFYAASNIVTNYEIGAVRKRPGYTRVGTGDLQSGKNITGLYNFRQSSSVQKMFATINDSGDSDTQLFYNSSLAGAWTEITDAETAWAGVADCNVEMQGFIGYCFFVGYDPNTGDFLPVASVTGTTFSTSTNVTSMPQGKYIKRYRDRLYVANCKESGSLYPYRVYFSSIPSAGAITWTVATDFIDVDYSEEITGIEEHWDKLVVLTEYSLYFYDQDTKKKISENGCSNHRNIKKAGDYLIWANQDGVWMSSGGRPINVAGRVIGFIRGVDMTNSFAEVVGERYYLYVGNVTVNGLSYTNTVLVFNIPSQTWDVFELYNDMTIFAKYYFSGQDDLYMGSASRVYRLGKYTDTTLLNGDQIIGSAMQPISSYFQTGFLRTSPLSAKEQLKNLFVFSDRAQNVEFYVRSFNKNSIPSDLSISNIDPEGKLDKFVNEFKRSSKNGYFTQLIASETGTDPYWNIWGFSLLNKINEYAKY